MFKYFIKQYISIIFILATFMGVFHHHNDFKQHNDCQICTIQASIADADTPVAVVYFTRLNIASTSTLKIQKISHAKTVTNPLKARAPPTIV
jgi:hypothetical protein